MEAMQCWLELSIYIDFMRLEILDALAQEAIEGYRWNV